MSITVERSFHLADIGGPRGGVRRSMRLGEDPAPAPAAAAPVHRVPRIARLMALAIRCESLLRSRAVPDASALARLAHVTQPRMTQILNLTLLAPDVQEALLNLPPVESGKPEICEKILRKLCSNPEWGHQRAQWSRISEG